MSKCVCEGAANPRLKCSHLTNQLYVILWTKWTLLAFMWVNTWLVLQSELCIWVCVWGTFSLGLSDPTLQIRYMWYRGLYGPFKHLLVAKLHAINWGYSCNKFSLWLLCKSCIIGRQLLWVTNDSILQRPSMYVHIMSEWRCCPRLQLPLRYEK